MLPLVDYVPHTDIKVKVYSTAKEGGNESLKDIKVTLNGNTENLKYLSKNFNESLMRLEEEKKQNMSIKHEKTLPDINVNKTQTNLGGYTSRPGSATTTLYNLNGSYTVL